MIPADIFLKSAAVGVAVAAPVGPMSLLCMRRTLVSGWRQGLAVGLGIAAGDGAYAATAALGLASVPALIVAWRQPLHLAAGLVLVGLGLRSLLRAGPAVEASSPMRSVVQTPVGLFAGSMLLTLTNPMTIVMFAAVLAALAPRTGLDPPGALATVGGVFAGSLCWWIGVTLGVSLLRRAIGPRARVWIDRVSGAFLVGFGLLELRRAF
jgi:threonine/homoserine/homoserine lactone efflux protein